MRIEPVARTVTDANYVPEREHSIEMSVEIRHMFPIGNRDPERSQELPWRTTTPMLRIRIAGAPEAMVRAATRPRFLGGSSGSVAGPSP